MPEKLLIGLGFKKLGIGLLGVTVASNQWVQKNWFEFVKLGLLVAGIVWGVGQTINSQGLAIERHGQDVVELKAQQIVDQADHKAFMSSLSKINTSQQVLQERLENMKDDIDENKDDISRNTSHHILREFNR
jgi:hypothetical protein